MDPITDFGFPQYDPKYAMQDGFRSISLIDDATFCIHIFAACQSKGHIPKDANRDHFVERCRKGLPEIPTTDVTIDGVSGAYRWNYRNSAGNWQGYYPQSRNNFSAYHYGSGLNGDGAKVLQQAAIDQATPQQCDDFSDGDSGMKPKTAPHGAVARKNSLLAPAQRVASDAGPVAVDLPGDGYPEATVVPGWHSDIAMASPTGVRTCGVLCSIQDGLVLGVTAAIGAIMLYLTKGALPPEPATPAITPFLGTDARRYPEA